MQPPKESEALLIDREAYRFQLAVTDSIADYVRELRWAQFGALSYRGADFGRAIALQLYFRLVNDLALRAAYARAAAGETLSDDPDVIPVGTEAYWLLRQMLGRHPRLTRTKVKEYLKRSWAMGLDHLRTPERSRPSNCGVLMLALSRRFFDYLLPVRQALGTDAAWLVPAGAAWADEAAARGEKIIPLGEERLEPEGPMTAPLAAYWCELALRFDSFRRILECEAPAAVMMTEGNQPDDEILARAAQTLGVRSICIQQGWSPVIHTGFRDMRYDEFCVWGPEFARLLQPYNKKQHFTVTGSHRIETVASAQQWHERGIGFFLQKDSVLISERAWREMLEFVCWTALARPERQILVREHPAAPLTMEEQALLAGPPNLILCPPVVMPLDAMLRRTGIAVAFFSTTLIEALAYDAVPLIINITGAPHYLPDLAVMGAGIEVKDFAAARAAMTELARDGAGPHARTAAIVPRFFACSSTQALGRIAAAAGRR